jgi:SNF2 family DNA or RNA helicase
MQSQLQHPTERKLGPFLDGVTLDQRMDLFKKYLDFSGMEHKSYQYEGVRWCLQNELQNDSSSIVKGGFIADEMGLGKTILMIGTFVAHIVPKTLVVVPLVLLDQWYTQIYKTTGHKAVIYHGPKRWSLNLDSAIIVLTTYDMISNSKKGGKNTNKRENILHSISWNRVVFDEAHHLRNKKTLSYSGAMMLKAQIRWLVSGTPIQNKKQDFYHLCSVLGMPPSFYMDPENLSCIASNYILKRTKKQVGIDMKDISLNREIVNWKNSKERELSQVIHSYLSFSQLPTAPAEYGLRLFGQDTLFNHLVMIMKARQCCILPRLMNKNTSQKIEEKENDALFNEGFSGTSKLDSVVSKMVERKNNGNGKLVFCHFKQEIDELARRLLAEGFKKVHVFDGRLSISKRKEILNTECEVLILQIQTGCEGLNLQEHYNEIYFVSPHWNPAVEDQAIARCHRLGQKKQVEVYKFAMSSFLNLEDDQEMESFSLDEYVTNIQNKKRNVASELLA